MNISNRLKELMKEKKLTKYRLAKDLNVHQTTIKNWLDGYEPSASHLNKLSVYFNVSSDYLMGLKQNREFPLSEKEVLLLELFDKLSLEKKDNLIALARKKLNN